MSNKLLRRGTGCDQADLACSSILVYACSHAQTASQIPFNAWNFTAEVPTRHLHSVWSSYISSKTLLSLHLFTRCFGVRNSNKWKENFWFVELIGGHIQKIPPRFTTWLRMNLVSCRERKPPLGVWWIFITCKNGYLGVICLLHKAYFGTVELKPQSNRTL